MVALVWLTVAVLLYGDRVWSRLVSLGVLGPAYELGILKRRAQNMELPRFRLPAGFARTIPLPRESLDAAETRGRNAIELETMDRERNGAKILSRDEFGSAGLVSDDSTID